MLLLIGSRVLGLCLLSAVVCNAIRSKRNAITYHRDYSAQCPLEEKHKTCADNVRFVLFTRSDRDNGQILRVTDDNVAQTYFNAANPTKFIIHDFMDGIRETPHVDMRTEYLKKGDYNLIMVDWGWLARGPYYCDYRAHGSTFHVGNCTAVLINMLREKYGLTDVHVIGLGVGAWTMHSISHFVKTKITRATGLDPNGNSCDNVKCFEVFNAMSQSDADFVDVIHTNSQGTNVLGTIHPVGHVDYYVNDGSNQPGCMVSYGHHSYNDNACSHRRSIQLFTESINSAIGFYGNQCDSLEHFITTGGRCPSKGPYKILMGENALNTTRGVLSIPTAQHSPYAL